MTTIRRTSRARLIVSLASAAAAVAVLVAPAVAAAPTCRDSGGARVCQKPGHSALHAKPTIRQNSGQLFNSAWLPGYGRGHLPPLIALD